MTSLNSLSILHLKNVLSTSRCTNAFAHCHETNIGKDEKLPAS